jgi:hypothetical protein
MDILIMMAAVLAVLLIAGCTSSSENGGNSDTSGADISTTVLSHPGFGNYTFDGQDEVRATVKKGTDVVHMMAMEDLPTDYGYTKDSAQYTVTSTGKHIKGYIDYSSDGYVVIMKPKSSSLTKADFMPILDTFQRVD